MRPEKARKTLVNRIGVRPELGHAWTNKLELVQIKFVSPKFVAEQETASVAEMNHSSYDEA